MRIKARSLSVTNGALISVDSQGSGEGGNIQIQAGSLNLDNQARITAETASSQGGNITLQVEDLLLIRRNSLISTNAGTAQAGGDGGNITIDADLIVAVPGTNSDITANAFLGSGGRIQITTQGIFGIEPRERLTPFNDITASSELGLAGIVEINTPNVDPSRGVADLPENFEAPPLTQGCRPGGAGTSGSFISTGRGGLPQSPDELSSNTVWEDLRSPTPRVNNRSSSATVTPPTPSRPERIVEAQGWIIGPNGNVILTAQPTAVALSNSWQTPATCQMH